MKDNKKNDLGWRLCSLTCRLTISVLFGMSGVYAALTYKPQEVVDAQRPTSVSQVTCSGYITGLRRLS